MKLLTLKFILIFIYLVSSSTSYAIQQLNLKNLIIHKDPKKLEKINFININNEIINLKRFENSLIVINFWATWCAPCREEMPSLDTLKTNLELSNLEIFPINIGRENLEKSKKFFEELKIKNMDIFFDNTVTLAKDLALRGVPTTILFNKEGKEFARIIGSIDFSQEQFIEWIKLYN